MAFPSGYHGDPRGFLSSPPVRVIFCGWESDTHKLQHNGWQMALHYEPYRHEHVMIFQHEYLELRGISDAFGFGRGHGGSYMGGDIHGPIIVRAICPRINVHEVATTERWNFQQIDAQPQWVEERTYNPFENVFRTMPNQAEATFIDKADMSVVDHLQKILEQQKPKQAELREKARKRSRGVKDAVANPISDIVLQVRAA